MAVLDCDKLSPWLAFLCLCLSQGREEMVLIPGGERRPLLTLGTSLPSVEGRGSLGWGLRSPHAPILGAWPAKPPRGPFVLCESDNGRHSQTSSHGSGPVKGPRRLHTEASVQQWRGGGWGGRQGHPRGTPPTFPGCHHCQGTSAGGRAGGQGQMIPEQMVGATYIEAQEDRKATAEEEPGSRGLSTYCAPDISQPIL